MAQAQLTYLKESTSILTTDLLEATEEKCTAKALDILTKPPVTEPKVSLIKVSGPIGAFVTGVCVEYADSLFDHW